MKLRYWDWVDVSIPGNGESFVGQSGETYLCTEVIEETDNAQCSFSRALPNGVVFKMRTFGHGSAFIGGECKMWWSVYLDNEMVNDGFMDTKEIKDAKLRVLAETLLRDLITKGKEDEKADKIHRQEQKADQEARSLETLKKLDY